VKPCCRTWLTLTLLLAAGAGLGGCNRRHGKSHEINYVSAPQAVLRDRMSTVFSKTGVVKNGDRVEVLEKERRFARVRTAEGAEGWIEQRYLVAQKVFDGFQKLKQQAQNAPVQASGTTRNDTNLHLTPGRETDHLYLLNQGAKVSLLQRTTAEKAVPGALLKPALPKPMLPKPTLSKPTPAGKEAAKPAGPVLEDWWLIRNPEGQVGWVLGRMIDVDVPLEIAQYAEGQRIVAAFVLNEVADADKKVAQYLVLATENKDGMPYDYDQVRVFTWNVRKHRYETAYREHNLNGTLPVTVTQESFDKEGTLPVFVLRVKDDSGVVSERKYKLNTPIVKRVLAPGEAVSRQPSAVRKRKRR
jgi:SH3-like domain-containing protein